MPFRNLQLGDEAQGLVQKARLMACGMHAEFELV